MIDLLKAFGRGVLYIILFPFFVLAIAIFAIIGLFAFIFQLVKSIIFFFTGRKFFPELPEDRELRLMFEAANAPITPHDGQETVVTNNNPLPPQNTVYEQYSEEDFQDEPLEVKAPQTPVEQECFKEEEPVRPVNNEEVKPVEEQAQKELAHDPDGNIFEDEDQDLISTDFEEEELEEYKPRGTDINDVYEDDVESTSDGLTIDFDDWGKK